MHHQPTVSQDTSVNSLLQTPTTIHPRSISSLRPSSRNDSLVRHLSSRSVTPLGHAAGDDPNIVSVEPHKTLLDLDTGAIERDGNN